MTCSFSMGALTKALPSLCRQCHPQASSLRTIRPFSSEPRRSADAEQTSSEPTTNTTTTPTRDSSSSLDILTRIAQGNITSSARGRPGNFRRAQSMEDEMLTNPYPDRAPPHHLHVFTHKHNTILTLTRPNGNPMMSMGSGQIGFRKGGRSGFDPAYQLCSHVLAQIQERGYLLEIQRLEIVYRGFGKGRDAFNKVILGNEGRKIRGLVSRVTDSTRIKFGGTRSRRVRRLG